MDTVFLFNF